MGDVGVAQLGSEARLVHEHVEKLRRIGKVRQDPFDRHGPGEASGTLLGSEEDLGHAPPRQAAGQAISAKGDANAHRGKTTSLLRKD